MRFQTFDKSNNFRSLTFIVAWIIGSVFCMAQDMPEPMNYWRDVTDISKGWKYLENSMESIPESTAAWECVDLPHTWNAVDAFQVKIYRRGASWYTREIEVAEKSKRYFVRFKGAGQQAKVYVDGKMLLSHIGGYSAFTVEITDAIQDDGKASIAVWVSNAFDESIAPLTADYNFYGGLYRGVSLLSTDKNCFSRTERGGAGMHWRTPNVSTDSAALNAWVLVDKCSPMQRVRFSLLDNLGRTVNSVEKKANCGRVDVTFPIIDKPNLWSPETPIMYKLKADLIDNNSVVDTVQVPCAFRWYNFNYKTGFSLNGKPYFLKGLNRHQDWAGLGNALSNKQHFEDILLMKELGANWLRLAHYQQSDYILQLCDQLGLLVWEEIPHINEITDSPAYFANCESMLKDMIVQHDIYPSIILWGLANEFFLRMMGDTDKKKATIVLIKRLNKLSKELDTDRPTAIACHRSKSYSDLGITDIPDVVGYNLYTGWYGKSEPNKIGENIEYVHSLNEKKPLIISEWGAGSDVRIHTETPTKRDFSEEYQCMYIEEYLNSFQSFPFLCGVNYWNFADFGSAGRQDSIFHINQKGLVTFARARKDAFYLVKSQWSSEPVCYLVSPKWLKRGGKSEKEFRVYSNCKRVELFHNGKSLSKKSFPFKWTVNLQEGQNVLEAHGKYNGGVVKHGYTLEYSQKNHADAYRFWVNCEELDEPKTLIDNSIGTRFSREGNVECVIQFPNSKKADGVTIDFFRGNFRAYKIQLAVSEDGNKWDMIFAGKSKGNVQTFPFVPQNIAFVKIIGAGNSENDWNSYNELILNDYSDKTKSVYESVED